jgi:hypothetical protein
VVKEMEHMAIARTQEPVAFRAKRKDRPTTRHLSKHRTLAFFRDFDYFIDFCLARFIVWREVRRANTQNRK